MPKAFAAFPGCGGGMVNGQLEGWQFPEERSVGVISLGASQELGDQFLEASPLAHGGARTGRYEQGDRDPLLARMDIRGSSSMKAYTGTGCSGSSSRPLVFANSSQNVLTVMEGRE